MKLNFIEKQNVLLDYCKNIRKKQIKQINIASDLCYDMNTFNDSPEQKNHTA